MLFVRLLDNLMNSNTAKKIRSVSPGIEPKTEQEMRLYSRLQFLLFTLQKLKYFQRELKHLKESKNTLPKSKESSKELPKILNDLSETPIKKTEKQKEEITMLNSKFRAMLPSVQQFVLSDIEQKNSHMAKTVFTFKRKLEEKSDEIESIWRKIDHKKSEINLRKQDIHHMQYSAEQRHLNALKQQEKVRKWLIKERKKSPSIQNRDIMKKMEWFLELHLTPPISQDQSNIDI